MVTISCCVCVCAIRLVRLTQKPHFLLAFPLARHNKYNFFRFLLHKLVVSFDDKSRVWFYCCHFFCCHSFISCCVLLQIAVVFFSCLKSEREQNIEHRKLIQLAIISLQNESIITCWPDKSMNAVINDCLFSLHPSLLIQSFYILLHY